MYIWPDDEKKYEVQEDLVNGLNMMEYRPHVGVIAKP